MRTLVTFRTRLFNTETPRDYFINDCCFGDDCAKWLAERLAREGVGEVDAAPLQEDWGWEFRVTTARHRLWVMVGSSSDEPDTWLVWVHSTLPRLKRWLGSSDDEDRMSVCAALDRVLKASPEIDAVRWHVMKHWMEGRAEAGAGSPGSA